MTAYSTNVVYIKVAIKYGVVIELPSVIVGVGGGSGEGAAAWRGG